MRETSPSVPHILSLRANFSWTFFGNIIYAGCQWLSLSVITRLGTTEMVGQFALGLAIATPVIMFASLELREVQVTDARDEFHFGEYLSLRLITTVLAILVIIGITQGLAYRRETALVILAVAVMKLVETVSDIFHGLFQKHERMDYVSISTSMRGVLSPIAMAIGMYLTGQVFWGVVGMAIAWCLVLFAYDIRTSHLLLVSTKGNNHTREEDQPRHTITRSPPKLKSLLMLIKLALPLGIGLLITTLNANVPRFLIENHLGEHELGIFAAVAYIPVVGVTVASALARSALPRLAKYYAAGNEQAFFILIIRLLGIGLALGIAGVIVAVGAGYPILLLLYGHEYALHANILQLQMIGAGVTYLAWFVGSAITATRYLRTQATLLGVIFFVNVPTCFWLIPRLGLVGASMAQIITVVVQVALSMIVLLFIMRRSFREKTSGL